MICATDHSTRHGRFKPPSFESLWDSSVSPSTRKLDLHGKRAAYGREQVGHLWLVDPADRTLEAFELREGEWVLIATAQDDAPVRIRPFDAVTFSLGDLWPPKVAPAE